MLLYRDVMYDFELMDEYRNLVELVYNKYKMIPAEKRFSVSISMKILRDLNRNRLFNGSDVLCFCQGMISWLKDITTSLKVKSDRGFFIMTDENFEFKYRYEIAISKRIFDPEKELTPPLLLALLLRYNREGKDAEAWLYRVKKRINDILN